MRNWFKTIAAAFWLLAAMPALAQSPPVDEAASSAGLQIDIPRIDAMIDSIIADRRTVGASVLVWHKGKEAHFHAAGLADREALKPFRRDTLVQIFSMTKPVTGVALMTLWEQGKFGLDDPLARHLPQFAAIRVADGLDADGQIKTRAPSRPITIRDVLRHTAGFTYGDSNDPVDRLFTQRGPLSAKNTLAQFGELMPEVPLLFDPGTHWHYSAAVDVQALLVEHFSGMPFAEYVGRTILQPLGMDDTGWRRDPSDLPRLAMLYAAQPDGSLAAWPQADWLAANFAGNPMTMGGSGLTSTVDDYMRFARMLLGGGSLDGVRILKPSTIRLMATDQLDPRIPPADRQWLPGKGSGGFGFDFFVRTGQPKTPDENRGAVGEFFWDGYPSMLFWVDPANDLAVVFATQVTPFDGTLHHDLRGAVYGPDYLGPPGD